MSFIISFGDNVIPHYSRIPIEVAQEPFYFEYKFTYPRVYTLVMYDRNDHTLNLFRSAGKILVDYVTPMKIEHTYVVELYECDPKDVITPPKSRDNFYGGNYGIMVGNAEFTITSSNGNNLNSNIRTSSNGNNVKINNYSASPSNSQGVVYHGEDRFVQPNPLTGKQQKYCSCMLHVLAKGGVDNPYAVCAKTTHTTYNDCWRYFAWSRLPTEELIAYASKHGVEVSQNREKMLENIYHWIASKP